MTQWGAVAVSCVLSFAAVLLVGVPLGGARRREGVYSASLGIFIFCCVKMVLVECGWGFAALFGVGTGLTIQLILLTGCFFFFRQLRETGLRSPGGSYVLRCGMLLCIGVGQAMWHTEGTGGDLTVYAMGEALHFALLFLAAGWMEEEPSQRNIGRWAAAAAVVPAVKGAGVCLLRVCCDAEDGAFGALLLMTWGVSGLLCELAYAISRQKELSPTGFAAGMIAAFCVVSLMG